MVVIISDAIMFVTVIVQKIKLKFEIFTFSLLFINFTAIPGKMPTQRGANIRKGKGGYPLRKHPIMSASKPHIAPEIGPNKILVRIIGTFPRLILSVSVLISGKNRSKTKLRAVIIATDVITISL